MRPLHVSDFGSVSWTVRATDLIDMYYVRQGELGYSNPMVSPGDRLIAVDGVVRVV